MVRFELGGRPVYITRIQPHQRNTSMLIRCVLHMPLMEGLSRLDSLVQVGSLACSLAFEGWQRDAARLLFKGAHSIATHTHTSYPSRFERLGITWLCFFLSANAHVHRPRPGWEQLRAYIAGLADLDTLGIKKERCDGGFMAALSESVSGCS